MLTTSVIDDIQTQFSQSFRVQIHDGLHHITSPFYFADGDGTVIALIEGGDGQLFLSDLGNTLFRADYEILYQNRMAQRELNRILYAAGATQSGGDIVKPLPDKWRAEAVCEFALALLKIDELNAHSKPEPRAAASLVLQEARARGNVVFEFSVEPPETAAGHRIRTNTLGSLLLQMQTMVGHAYQSALRDLEAPVRKEIDANKDGHLMDVVVPAAPGSYRVVLEAAKSPDMLGSGELARGLSRLDDVFAVSDDPAIAPEALQRYKGRLADSYIKLMHFLAQNRTGLRYIWAHYKSDDAPIHGVTKFGAAKLAEIFSEVESLDDEPVSVSGEFQRFNRDSRRWALLSEDGTVESGETDGDGPSLDGFVVGHFYKFHCIKRINLVAGREKHTLLLKRVEQAHDAPREPDPTPAAETP